MRGPETGHPGDLNKPRTAAQRGPCDCAIPPFEGTIALTRGCSALADGAGGQVAPQWAEGKISKGSGMGIALKRGRSGRAQGGPPLSPTVAAAAGDSDAAIAQCATGQRATGAETAVRLSLLLSRRQRGIGGTAGTAMLLSLRLSRAVANARTTGLRCPRQRRDFRRDCAEVCEVPVFWAITAKHLSSRF